MYSADMAVVLLVLKFEMSSYESERNCLVHVRNIFCGTQDVHLHFFCEVQVTEKALQMFCKKMSHVNRAMQKNSGKTLSQVQCWTGNKMQPDV
jgi:hypothetical protein